MGSTPCKSWGIMFPSSVNVGKRFPYIVNVREYGFHTFYIRCHFLPNVFPVFFSHRIIAVSLYLVFQTWQDKIEIKQKYV
jgi:hypothetical protein